MIKTELALAYSIYPIFLYLLNVDKINLDESIFNCPSVNLYFLNTTKSSQLQLPFQALQQTPRFVGFLFCFVLFCFVLFTTGKLLPLPCPHKLTPASSYHSPEAGGLTTQRPSLTSGKASSWIQVSSFSNQVSRS